MRRWAVGYCVVGVTVVERPSMKSLELAIAYPIRVKILDSEGKGQRQKANIQSHEVNKVRSHFHPIRFLLARTSAEADKV